MKDAQLLERIVLNPKIVKKGHAVRFLSCLEKDGRDSG